MVKDTEYGNGNYEMRLLQAQVFNQVVPPKVIIAGAIHGAILDTCKMTLKGEPSPRSRR